MTTQIFMVDEVGRWVKPPDPVTSHRDESWRIDLLNNSDTNLGTLDGVIGGDFTLNVNATIRGGGSLTYTGDPVDWNQRRVQPWYRAEAGGQVITWPLGVFIVATPGQEHDDPGVTQSLALYDKTLILDQDKISTTFQAPAGANVVQLVRSVLLAANQTRSAIVDSTAKLANPMVWEAGVTSRLRIINDLLESINYFSLSVDGYGVFRAGPYQAAADRGITYQFIDDETSIYSPKFTYTHDTFEVPNRVVCVGQSDGETPALVGVAEDNGTGPFSSVTRGRVITRTEEGVDATDQATLNALADRYLREGQMVGSSFQISHAPIELWFNDVVLFKRSARDIEALCVVQSLSFSMDTGALCSTSLREVASD